MCECMGVPRTGGVDLRPGAPGDGAGKLAADRERQRRTDPARGITVNAGVIGGGTRALVAARLGRSDVSIDQAIDEKRMARRSVLCGIGPASRLEITGGLNGRNGRTSGRPHCSPTQQQMAAGLGFIAKSKRQAELTGILPRPGNPRSWEWNGCGGRRRHAPQRHPFARCSRSRTALRALIIGGLVSAVGRGKGQSAGTV